MKKLKVKLGAFNAGSCSAYESVTAEVEGRMMICGTSFSDQLSILNMAEVQDNREVLVMKGRYRYYECSEHPEMELLNESITLQNQLRELSNREIDHSLTVRTGGQAGMGGNKYFRFKTELEGVTFVGYELSNNTPNGPYSEKSLTIGFIDEQGWIVDLWDFTEEMK